MPRGLGYVFPAEWCTHEATWLGWPHNRSDWPAKLASVKWVYGEIARHIAPGEQLHILVASSRIEQEARRYLQDVGVSLNGVRFFQIPTDRGWTRDSGPMFVKHMGSGELAVLRFRFNAWAKYRDWELDAQIPRQVAARLSCRLFSTDFCLEGGAVEMNDDGLVITTEECLLDQTTQVRNLGMSRQQVETEIKDYLGAREILWLGHGIEGDDTHGHVDDLCRFVNRTTVVLCRESNSRDSNYGRLEESHERLQQTPLNVVSLPMPAPLFFRGRRLPASYANFYIANAAVLVPTFNDPADRLALGLLSELFRDRKVIGIHAVDLIWGFGALHCLTQQQPARAIGSGRHADAPMRSQDGRA